MRLKGRESEGGEKGGGSKRGNERANLDFLKGVNAPLVVDLDNRELISKVVRNSK